MKKILIRGVVSLYFTLISMNIAYPQERKLNLGAEYTTELHTDFDSKINWVNLILLSGEYSPWKNGTFTIQTISTYKTRNNRILDDFQTFSNIEEDNMALNIFLAGYEHRFGSVSLFGGIRNMNEDYFTGEYTSLFTNSSCGIYPTLSSNYPAPNYPLSALCLHTEVQLLKKLALKNSLYNGVSGKLYDGDNSLVSINPGGDGVFNITELSYMPGSDRHRLYSVGGAFRTHNNGYGSTGAYAKRKKFNYTIWVSAEQEIYSLGNRKIGMLAHGSYAPNDKNDCRSYYGGGILFQGFLSSKHPDSIGLFANHALFREKNETALELTWRREVYKGITIQPAVHCIITGSKTNTIGLFRMIFSL